MGAFCPDTRHQAGPGAAGAGLCRLVALQVENLVETSDGLRVLIRRSKGDQEGQGET